MNHWYTETLTLAESKKLFNSLTRLRKLGQWTDFNGKGGVLTEITFENFSSDQVGKIRVPDYCPCFTLKGYKSTTLKKLPDVLHPCGEDWKLWKKGGRWGVGATFYSMSLQRPLRVGFRTDNEGGYYRSKIGEKETTEFCLHWGDNIGELLPKNLKLEGLEYRWIQDEKGARGVFIPTGKPLGDLEYRKADDMRVIKKISEMLIQYEVPQGNDTGVFEYNDLSESSITVTMEAGHPWAIGNYSRIIRDLTQKEAKDGAVRMDTEASQGAFSTICVGPENVTAQIEDMIHRFLDYGSYDKIDGNYSILKPESWRTREKRRKKWKKSIFQELGSLEFKGAGKADVKVLIEKEGYVFTLDFETADGAFAFPDNPLFEKTEWHTGAE